MAELFSPCSVCVGMDVCQHTGTPTCFGEGRARLPKCLPHGVEDCTVCLSEAERIADEDGVREERLVREMATIVQRRWEADGVSVIDGIVERLTIEESRKRTAARKLDAARVGLEMAISHAAELRMDTPEDEALRLRFLSALRLAEKLSRA